MFASQAASHLLVCLSIRDVPTSPTSHIHKQLIFPTSTLPILGESKVIHLVKVPIPVVRAWCNLLHRGRYRRYAMGDDVVVMCRRCKRRMLMVNGQVVEDHFQRQDDLEPDSPEDAVAEDAVAEDAVAADAVAADDDMPFEDG